MNHTAVNTHTRVWDEGFFIARTDPERIPVSRPTQVSTFILPNSWGMDMPKILDAWEAVGVKNDATWIMSSTARMYQWLNSKPGAKKKGGIFD